MALIHGGLILAQVAAFLVVWRLHAAALTDEPEAEIEHGAFHDGLTGLPNRALFFDRLEHALALAKRHGAPLSLLYIDLDDFKTINDHLGQAVGDEVLTQVGRRLRAMLREADTVARLGGDEFAVILEHTSAVGAEAVATQLLAAMQSPFSVDDTRVLSPASIGIAIAETSHSAGDLLRHAEIAMSAAKRQGKHGHCVFNEARR